MGNYSNLTTATIPSTVTYNGTTYSVTSIGYNAFSGCSSLSSITIPNSVTSIGWFAFYGCSSLTSMVVENGNTTYDSREKCNAIIETATNTLVVGCKNTTIPNSVTSIGNGAFSGCSSLTAITIPNSVTSIGGSAFYGCSSLTSITVEKGNSIYDSRENCNAVIETAINTLIAGCQNTIIPNSVTSIGGDAFSGCSSLTAITIPNSVMRIGAGAFDGTGIYYDESNWENNVLYIDNCLIKASLYSTSGSYTIKENTRLIADYAFAYCPSLTSITIPNSVTSIGKEAFSNCSSLTSLTIPCSVRSIGECAFSHCSSFTYIVVENGNTAYDSRENCNAIIETATNTLIAGCQNTFIPNSVTSIGNGAFEFCTSLTSITIPSSVTSIGRGAFASCSSLTSITIPNSVTSIGDYAFSDCYSLTSITIPNSVTSIGNYAFSGCSSLPVENILRYADTYLVEAVDKTLSTYSIKEGTKWIGDFAFYNCSSLSSITIPNSVKSIGEWAFRDCSSLTTVICKAIRVPELGPSVFKKLPLSEATLYVPAESLEDYKAADQWKEFGTILPLDKDPSAVKNTRLPITNSTKLLRNGQVYILQDGKTYTITGQKL